MKKKINKTQKISLLLIIILIITIIFRCIIQLNSNNNTNTPTYIEAVEAVDYSLIGLEEIKNNLQNEDITEKQYYFDCLKFISSYMATGDEKYLKIAKEGANYIESNISNIGLIGENSISTSSDQSSALFMISYLNTIDNKYTYLIEKLADGIINNYINNENNLVWSKLNLESGEVINDENYGYESQFSHSSLKAVQALLLAYKEIPEKIEYKNAAINIINSIWERRDRETNLISESWDILNDKAAINLYPYENFRYDDMGGVYLRTLMLAYNVTGYEELIDIMNIYSSSLVDGVWDTTINGGAFRYLNTTKGESSSVPMVETMYGLFTATLLEVSEITGNYEIREKCIENAENILVSGFGLKNNMVPHAIDNLGEYLNENSDSQLGYAIIQFPLGYNMLSNITDNEKYREKTNEIIKVFLERHKIKNEDIPLGYMKVVETQSPYEIESDYSTTKWMSEIAYLPFYLLYNSIEITGDVKINWEYELQPNVLGLASDIPIWDTNLVKMDLNNKTLILNEVTGKGTINLEAIGLGNISYVLKDGEKYNKFNKNKIETEEGKHSYEIKWK